MELRNLIKAVDIIKKHATGTDFSGSFSAEHDQIWLCDLDLIPKGEDSEAMEKLGFFEDEDAWSCYT